MITKTIRGMNHVSPLAKMKFSNRSPDDILNIYFPAAAITTVGKTDIVIDKDCPVNPEDFIVKAFGTDTDGDGVGDRFAFYLALFISNDGLKVREAYECTAPREDELVLFVENNENDVSSQMLFAKMHPELRKKFTLQNGSLNPNLFDEDILKIVNENGGGISLETLEELVVNGKIEEKNIPLKTVMKGLTYIVYTLTAPGKAVGWLCRKAGEGIDILKIAEEFWDTQSEDYFLKKENVIKSLQADTAMLDQWITKIENDPQKLEWNDLIPGFVKEKTKKAYEDLKIYAEKYNQFVESNINTLYAQIDKTGVADLLKIKEGIALYSGMWNGLVDFVSSIFHFAAMILEAPFDMAPDMEYILEIYDNCTEVFRKMDFAQIGVMLTGMYEEIKKHFKEKNGEDYDLVRISYCVGFLLVFIATFFIPFAALLKIANIGKVGKTREILTKFMNEVGGTYTKSVNFIEQKSSAALKSSLSSLRGMLELFSDVKNLKAFLERVWKSISEWFVKNKKSFESILSQAKKIFIKDSKTDELFRDISKKFIVSNKGTLSKTQFLKIAKQIEKHFGTKLHWVDRNSYVFRDLFKKWYDDPIFAVFHESTFKNGRYGIVLEGPAIYFFEGVHKLGNKIQITAYTLQHELIHLKLWYKMTKEFPELTALYDKIPRWLDEANVIGEIVKQNAQKIGKWDLIDIENDLTILNDMLLHPAIKKEAQKILGKEQLELKDFENWDLSKLLEKL